MLPTPPQESTSDAATVVVKFGGAVLQSASGFRSMQRTIAGILDGTDVLLGHHAPAGLRLLVVVSAFASTTRDLEYAALLSQRGQREQAQLALNSLAEKHLAFVNELIDDEGEIQTLTLVIREAAQEIAGLLDSVDVTRQLTPRTLDRVLAYGELLALHIARHVLTQAGIRAAWTDARRILVTNNEHGHARPLAEKSAVLIRETLSPLLDNHECVVIQGFVGATQDGITTTMGKESSTLTATFLGALLHADEVRLYTDVAGVCSADPKVFPNAVTHSVLSFDQARIAAHQGLKLLYATAIEPAQQAAIPVRILDASKPDRATMIGGNGVPYAPIVILPDASGSNGTDSDTTQTVVCIVLANTAMVLQCLGRLSTMFSDSASWEIAILPDQQRVELRLPAESAHTIAQYIHNELVSHHSQQ
ncbi:MAG: hypothetical protein J5I53_05900 [Bradyrhizobiaceae bacterium]|nr:hypothetical protein [Bradyrhizobiaceae bacterium]